VHAFGEFVTNALWDRNGTSVWNSCVQPKCLTGPKVMSLSLWGQHIECLVFILPKFS